MKNDTSRPSLQIPLLNLIFMVLQSCETLAKPILPPTSKAPVDSSRIPTASPILSPSPNNWNLSLLRQYPLAFFPCLILIRLHKVATLSKAQISAQSPPPHWLRSTNSTSNWLPFSPSDLSPSASRRPDFFPHPHVRPERFHRHRGVTRYIRTQPALLPRRMVSLMAIHGHHTRILSHCHLLPWAHQTDTEQSVGICALGSNFTYGVCRPMFAVSWFGPTPSRELLETLANCMITVLQLVNFWRIWVVRYNQTSHWVWLQSNYITLLQYFVMAC